MKIAERLNKEGVLPQLNTSIQHNGLVIVELKAAAFEPDGVKFKLEVEMAPVRGAQSASIRVKAIGWDGQTPYYTGTHGWVS